MRACAAATIPKALTMDRALELLAERRAKGPAPKKTRRVAGKR